MTFEQLMYYVEAYQQKSFTKAAEKLFVTRQVISTAIKKLEEEFHTALFVRSANRIEPTESGKEFYHYAVQMMLLKDELTLKMKHNSMNSVQIYKIALTKTPLNLWGDKLYNALSVFSSARFSYDEVTVNEYKQAYEFWDIAILLSQDFVFSFLGELSEKYKIRKIAEMKQYARISVNHPLAKKKTLTFSDLAPYDLLMAKEHYSPDLIELPQISSSLIPMYLTKQIPEYIEISESYTLETEFPNSVLPGYEVRTGNTILRPVNADLHFYIIYDKEIDEKIINQIISVVDIFK